MTTMARLAGLLVATAMLAGCIMKAFVDDSMSRLAPGQNKVQVSAILGAPAKLNKDGDREAWLYCFDGAAVDHYVIAWFRGFRLVKAESFPDYEWGECLEFFDSFSFDQMPEIQYEDAKPETETETETETKTQS